MTITRRKLTAVMTALLIFICSILAVASFASSPVTCTGDDAGTTASKHYYTGLWILGDYHWEYSYSHTVDRAWAGHVYKVEGHTSDNCGQTNLNYDMSPCKGTVVGYA